jgi:hypothetical protein
MSAYTNRQAADLLGMDEKQIRRDRRSGRLPADGLLTSEILAKAYPDKWTADVADKVDEREETEIAGRMVGRVREILDEGGVEDPGGPLTLDRMRIAQGIVKTQTLDIQLKLLRGEVVKLEDVQATGLRIAIGFRRAMENTPARHAAQLAAELGCDPVKLESLWSAALKTELDALASTVAPA